MSLRLRLALCCAALCGQVLLAVGTLAYAVHSRGQYDDLDRFLIGSASHAVAEATAMGEPARLAQGSGGFAVVLRLYGPDAALREDTPNGALAPLIDPQAVLAAPAGPAYGWFARLAPLASPDLPPASAFGTIISGGERWRAFVLPIRRPNDGALLGYVEAVAPLGQIDASIATFRAMLLSLAALGLAAALLGGLLVAGQALQPVTELVATARAVSASRDLSQRIPEPRQRDELGTLTTTFNRMLASIEQAYNAQQRFVADASHELRAPLTAIQGNLELVRRRPDLPGTERVEALNEASREAERLTRLVADLLALARADAGVPIRWGSVDLDAVVLDTFQSGRALASDRTLHLDPFEPVRVCGDEDRLRQLVLILLDNAVKYTPPGGSVTLGLRQVRDSAEITVRDTGIGIAPADLPHVFERFFRADPARSRDPGGTGLGLAIAHWIVEQHRGTISIESTPGQGTHVLVRLPALP
jgi:two-component system, OmpR family, sensor kinase